MATRVSLIQIFCNIYHFERITSKSFGFASVFSVRWGVYFRVFRGKLDFTKALYFYEAYLLGKVQFHIEIAILM